MNAHSNKAFYYHSHASSLGGIMRQPLQRVVSSDASVSLASAGGYASRRVEKFHVDGLISVEAAHVRVSGSEHGGDAHDPSGRHRENRTWRTITAATVEGLNILEVVTADRIVAQISVDHPHDESPSKVTLLGSRFDNLRVHGAPVKPVMDKRVIGHWTGEDETAPPLRNAPLSFDELIEESRRQHGLRKKHYKSSTAPRLVHNDPDKDLETKGSALCSLVHEVGVEAPVESFSHMLRIPDFGNIFLGELLVSRFSVQVTMLRVEMGCMADADVSVATGVSNGHTMP